VNPYEHGGGAEYQISLLIDALVASGGHEVHYVTHFVNYSSKSRNYSVRDIGGGGPVPRLGYMMKGWSLYQALRDISPHVIYQRVACAYTGLCALYSMRRSIPMLWHVAHDTDVAPQVLEPARNVPRQRLEKWAVEFGARNATGIVVQTQHQAQLLKKHYNRTADKVIPNFHPPATESIDKSGEFTVLWIANLKQWKRPEVFVRLAGRFATRKDIRFVMVGAPAAAAGNITWRKSLMREIEAAPNLHYLGEKTQDEVNTLLAQSHVLVNTSTHEGFPNTFIQAWLRDAAVVSLSVDPDGVLERDNVGIATHTEPALEAAVRKLLDDPDSLSGYAKRGREHAKAYHSLANSLQLVELLETFGRRVQHQPV
jgi:glycosyltransferase involved in cell wall biosynthesis